MADAQYAAPVLTGPQIQALLRAAPDRELWLRDAAAHPQYSGAARRAFHAELRALQRAQESLQRAYASLLFTPPAPADPAIEGQEGQGHGTT